MLGISPAMFTFNRGKQAVWDCGFPQGTQAESTLQATFITQLARAGPRRS